MRLNKTLLFTSLLLGGASFNAGAQNLIYDWGHKWGGASGDQGTCIATDSDGNVIVVSEFASSIDADPGAGISTLTHNGSVDIAISKFDSDGNLIWAKSVGGPGEERAIGMHVDNTDNIYVTGFFQSTVDFDPNAGVDNQTSLGAGDIYLLSLDSDGNFQWVYTNGTVGHEEGNGVVTDNAGNVYLTGFFRGTMDFDKGVGVANYTAVGSADIYMLKLSATGNYVSNYHMGGPADEVGRDINIDSEGNLYVTGWFQNIVDFDGGAGTAPLTGSSNDLFLVKINSNNTYGWAHKIGAGGLELGITVAVDNNDDIFVGGYYSATVDFDPTAGVDNKTAVGSTDMLLVKFDNTGNYLMGITAGGIYDDLLNDIVFDSDNNIITTGFMRGTIDFDPGPGTQNVSVTAPANFADQFYWKLDEGGNYVWAEHVGGGNNDHGFAVATDGQFLYSTGYFQGTADFDLTSGVANVTSSGSSDVSFVKHINCNPINTNDVIVSCGDYTWIDGITYTSNNNTATHLLTNQYGCDSTVHLNLIIKSIDDQTVTPSATTLCDNGNVTVDLGSSQAGVFYSLVDQSTSTVVDGPIEGTGSTLTLDGGNITSTTTYEVQAESNKYNSLTFTGNSPTPSFVSLGTDVNKVFAGTTAITVEAWINSDNNNDHQSVISTYNGLGNTMQFLLRLDQVAGQNKATFWVGTGTTPGSYVQVIGTTTILPGTWYHLAATYDGANVSIYVNGVLENQVAVTSPIPDLTNELRIGGGLDNNTEYFYGDITGVRLWNVARTQTEINDNKSICIEGNESGLVAMYNMIDGSGSSTLTDESVNGYDGVLMNMDANTSWNYTNMPAMTCSMCNLTMTETPTVTVNYSNTGTDVQEACVSYLWIDGNTYTSSNSTATHTLTNISGCDSVVTLNLTINTPDATTDVQSACDSYLWIDGNTYTADNTTAFVTLTNMNGCDSVVTLNLNIETSPVAGAVNNGDGTMSATGTGTYQWIDCGTNTPVTGATSATFIPSANGDYAVVVTNGSCDDTSACVTYNSVGIDENSAGTIVIYPNPTSGVFTINLGTEVSAVTVKITNSVGQLVYTENVSGAQTLELNLEQANGIYFVHVYSESGLISTTRVVKQ